MQKSPKKLASAFQAESGKGQVRFHEPGTPSNRFSARSIYPALAVLTAIGCIFVMIKYGAPAPQKLSSKKHHRRLLASAPGILGFSFAHLSRKKSPHAGGNKFLASATLDVPTVFFPAPSTSNGPQVAASNKGMAATSIRATSVVEKKSPPSPLSVSLRHRSEPKSTHRIVKAITTKLARPERMVPQKRVVKAQTVNTKITRPSSEPTIDLSFIDHELESQLDEGDGGKVNVTSPLEELALKAFREPSQSEDFAGDPYQSSVQVDPLLSLDQTFPRLRLDYAVVGRIERNSFSEIHARLSLLQKSVPVSPSKAANEPELVLPKKKASAVVAQSLSNKSSKDTQSAQLVKVSLAEKKEVTQLAPEVSPRSSVTHPPIKVDGLAPELSMETPTRGRRDKISSRLPEPSLSIPKAKSVASENLTTPSSPLHLSNRAIAGTNSVDIPHLTNQRQNSWPVSTKVVSNASVETVRKVGRMMVKAPSAPGNPWEPIGRDIDVDLNLALVRSYLDDPKVNGHLEFYLEPENSRDPQDRVPVSSYVYPSDRMILDTRERHGSFKLVGYAFKHDSSSAEARVECPELISATNRSKISWTIDPRDLKKYHPGEIGLTMVVFEGAAGNPDAHQVVPNALIRFVNCSQCPVLKSNTEGIVKIKKVPANSELLVEAEAPGYYPNYQYISIFSRFAYVPVFLTSKDKVEAVSVLTKQNVAPNSAQILLRDFDSKTRIPKEGEVISLASNYQELKEIEEKHVPFHQPIYFGVFPDPDLHATTMTGMAGWLGLKPWTYQSVVRGAGQHSELLSLWPGIAKYFELGRAGVADFLAKVGDPFRHQTLPSEAHLIGDIEKAVSDEHGVFRIKNIDFGPGIITVETSSVDPDNANSTDSTLHTVAWNTAEMKGVRTLPIVSRELLEVVADRNHIGIERGTGILYGRPRASYFKAGDECLTPVIKRVEGLNSHPYEAHPVRLFGETLPNQALCLTPKNHWFSSYNLPPGDYTTYYYNQKHELRGAHVDRVVADKKSSSVI